MEAIIIIIVAILVLTAIIIIVSSNIPNTWTIEKAVLVNAPNHEIFPYLKDLSLWQEWTVWSPEYESDLTFEYPTQQTAGVGAIQKWMSLNLNAVLTLTEVKPQESITFTLKLHKEDITLSGTIVLGVADTYFTQVAWRLQLNPTKKKNLIQKYIAYNLRKSFDEDLEESLQNLVLFFADKFPNVDEIELDDSSSLIEDDLA